MISFKGEQREKVDKLLTDKTISKVCQDAIDKYFEIPQGKEQLEQAISEEELKVQQSNTRKSFLQGKLELINESERQENIRKAHEEKIESEKQEKIRANKELLKRTFEQQKEKEKLEKEQKQKEYLRILDLVIETTDFPKNFAEKFTKDYLTNFSNTSLCDILLRSAQVNGYCFDRDKFLQLNNGHPNL